MRGGMTTESGSAFSLLTTGVGATRAMEPQHGARERRVRNQSWRILGTNWARNSSDQLRPRAPVSMPLKSLLTSGRPIIVRLHLCRWRGERVPQLGMDDVRVSAMTMIDRDAFSAYPYLPETLGSFTLTPVGTGGDYQVVENAELFPVVADSLGVEKLRVLRTPIDVLGAPREQWDDGNNFLAVASGVIFGYERSTTTNTFLRKQESRSLPSPDPSWVAGVVVPAACHVRSNAKQPYEVSDAQSRSSGDRQPGEICSRVT